MLREFYAFHCDIESGCVFGPGILPPPLHHIDRLAVALWPRRRAEQLEAKFTVDVQDTIRTDKLRDRGRM